MGEQVRSAATCRTRLGFSRKMPGAGQCAASGGWMAKTKSFTSKEQAPTNGRRVEGVMGWGNARCHDVHYADQRLRTTGVFSFKLWLCSTT